MCLFGKFSPTVHRRNKSVLIQNDITDIGKFGRYSKETGNSLIFPTLLLSDLFQGFFESLLSGISSLYLLSTF